MRTCKKYNLLQLAFSACMAAVKCRPVLHHCVVIFVLVLNDYGLYVVKIKNKKSPAHELVGVSGVTSFITTDRQL